MNNLRFSIIVFSLLVAPLYAYSQEKVKNVILIIGDGMGLAQVNAAMFANSKSLNLEKATSIGLVKTGSASDCITDSGAGATAMATGKKTYNQAIAIGMKGDTLKTVLEYANEAGLRTGLVSTSAITHATPASFIAHNSYRGKYEEIAEDFVKNPIDIFIGGGKTHFEVRQDGRNLSNELRKKGFQVVYSVEDIDVRSGSGVACLADEVHLPGIHEGRDADFLSKATAKSIEKLSQNKEGFFLMIEGSQIDWGGHANDGEYVVNETLDLDKAIGKAFDFADKTPGTLVIVTADHETGGLILTDGDAKKGEKVGLRFSTTHHTAIMVPVFSYGAGAEQFTGIYENTEIFHKVINLLGLTYVLKINNGHTEITSY